MCGTGLFGLCGFNSKEPHNPKAFGADDVEARDLFAVEVGDSIEMPASLRTIPLTKVIEVR